MKTLVIILTSLCFFSCFGKDFKIVESTSQKWVGGIPGSGKGTNYVIKIVPYKNSDKLHIDKIWIGNKYFEVTPLTDPRNKKSTSFQEKDTLYIRIHHYIRTNMQGEVLKPKLSEENELPHEYEGEALLAFTYKGKRKYKVIKEFKKLKFIPYP